MGDYIKITEGKTQVEINQDQYGLDRVAFVLKVTLDDDLICLNILKIPKLPNGDICYEGDYNPVSQKLCITDSAKIDEYKALYASEDLTAVKIAAIQDNLDKI